MPGGRAGSVPAAGCWDYAGLRVPGPAAASAARTEAAVLRTLGRELLEDSGSGPISVGAK